MRLRQAAGSLLIFIGADRRSLDVAAAEGFEVVDVETARRLPGVAMKSIITIVIALLLVAAAVTFGSSEQTWTGEISDGLCRAEHLPLSEGDPVLPSPECVKVCHRAGYKYVFVVDEKVYEISNQDNPDLTKFAGHSARITGELKGESITVSKVDAPGN